MTTQSITPDQEKQYRRFVEDGSNLALKEVNPDKDGLQRLFARGGEFQAYVVTGIRRFTSVIPNYDLVRTILGRDFISPEEIIKSRGVMYTDEMLLAYGSSLPSQEDLEWCRSNGMILVSGPANPTALLEVRDLKAGYFYSKTEGWYAEADQKFSWNDKAETGWLALRKAPIDGSLNENWNSQKRLVVTPMIVPNAGEVTWGLTTYKAVRGIELHLNVHVRTSSLDLRGGHVSAGFDAEGLGVGIWYGDHCDSRVGMSGARKWALKS